MGQNPVVFRHQNISYRPHGTKTPVVFRHQKVAQRGSRSDIHITYDAAFFPHFVYIYPKTHLITKKFLYRNTVWNTLEKQHNTGLF